MSEVNGKGDKRRQYDRKRFYEGFEHAFGAKEDLGDWTEHLEMHEHNDETGWPYPDEQNR